MSLIGLRKFSSKFDEIFLFSFFFFMAISVVYRSSQARGGMGATAADLCHSQARSATYAAVCGNIDL